MQVIRQDVASDDVGLVNAEVRGYRETSGVGGSGSESKDTVNTKTIFQHLERGREGVEKQEGGKM